MQVQLKKDKPIISVPIRAVDMKQAAFSKKKYAVQVWDALRTASHVQYCSHTISSIIL